MPALAWYTPAFQEFNHLLQVLELAQGGGLGVELVDREVLMHEPHLFRGISLAGSTEHLGHMCAACPWRPRPALGLSVLCPCAGVSDG